MIDEDKIINNINDNLREIEDVVAEEHGATEISAATVMSFKADGEYHHVICYIGNIDSIDGAMLDHLKR